MGGHRLGRARGYIRYRHPRQEAQHDVQCILFAWRLGREARPEDKGKDEGIRADEQQRMDHCPGQAERRADVAQAQLAFCDGPPRLELPGNAEQAHEQRTLVRAFSQVLPGHGSGV